jgi:UDP-galactopyranose mutase
MELKMYDCLIVGCGFAGAAAARKLADSGKSVLLCERRTHIAGNMYDCPDDNGVLIHRYGPHIFHTQNKEVFEFLERFSEFFPYEHRVLGKIDGKLVPIPFNFLSFDLLYEKSAAEEIKLLLTEAFSGSEKVSVLELMESSDDKIRAAGEYIYKNVFENYTAKQWGVPPEEVDKSVINRVPVKLGYDDRYFTDVYQYMPAHGFTKLFESLLDHPLITVELGCDALSRLSIDFDSGTLSWDGEKFDRPVIYTGPVDELFGCRFGRLPYRSLDLVFRRMDMTRFQPAAVVNYPNEEDLTRITEFKYLTAQQLEGATTILYEYPLDYDIKAARGNIPYYAVINPQNTALYEKYKELAQGFGNLYLCGRLAEYKYYNMDAAVGAALNVAQQVQF